MTSPNKACALMGAWPCGVNEFIEKATEGGKEGRKIRERGREGRFVCPSPPHTLGVVESSHHVLDQETTHTSGRRGPLKNITKKEKKEERNIRNNIRH